MRIPVERGARLHMLRLWPFCFLMFFLLRFWLFCLRWLWLRLFHFCLPRLWLLDIMYISIGFITFYLYLLLSSLSADFTMIVQHYSCLYCLSYFVFIHVLIIGIRGKNWGICGVTKRAVTMPPSAIKLFSDCPFPFVWYSAKRGCTSPLSLQGCYALRLFLRSADCRPVLCTVLQMYLSKRVL